MGADRGVDAAMGAFGLAHRLVQGLAHAVQALELEGVEVVGHFEDRGNGVGVVGGELRVDAVGHAEQLARAGDVGDVGVGLAGEDRVAGQPHRLGALDLGVPVGALDEADHDAAVEPFGQRVQPVDDEGRARTVGLDDDAKTIPAGERGIGQRRLDDVERQVEPVGLLGVDVQPHAGVARGEAERRQPLDHHRHHPRLLRVFVARMDRRELDRDAGIAAHLVAARPAGQRRDRVGIGAVVAQGVCLGAGRLAQHVVGIEIALADIVAAAPHGFVDGAAEHELLAHLAHGGRDGGADDRLAEPPHHGAQRPLDGALALVQHAARQHQRPGRGVDEDGRRFARMRRPVVRGDLVADQVVHGLGVGHAQQRLGQAHQRHAFLRRQAVFGQEHFHQLPVGRRPDGANQPGGAGGNLGALRLGKPGGGDEVRQCRVLVGQIVGADGVAEVWTCRHGDDPWAERVAGAPSRGGLLRPRAMGML